LTTRHWKNKDTVGTFVTFDCSSKCGYLGDYALLFKNIEKPSVADVSFQGHSRLSKTIWFDGVQTV